LYIDAFINHNLFTKGGYALKLTGKWTDKRTYLWKYDTCSTLRRRARKASRKTFLIYVCRTSCHV